MSVSKGDEKRNGARLREAAIHHLHKAENEREREGEMIFKDDVNDDHLAVSEFQMIRRSALFESRVFLDG